MTTVDTRTGGVADVLADPAHAEALRTQGFVQVGRVLDDAQIAALREVYVEVVERLGGSEGEVWFPTGLLPDAALRRFVSDRCRAVATSAIEPLFVPGSIEVTRIDLVVKPSGPDSALGPHQDYSVVDERTHRSYYLWLPLIDVSAQNGGMHVVPGSHLLGPEVRSRFVPADLGPLSEVVVDHAVSLPMAAGELLLTDAALIHHTPPNRSGSTRVAVHGILRPTAAPLVFYFADEATPDGQVEAFEMDIEAYLEATQHGRPDRPADYLQPAPTHHLDQQVIEDLCAAGPSGERPS